MVEKTDDAANLGAGDELAREIANLKREIARLKEAIAERADDIVGGASRAAQAVRTQASAVTGAVRDNPGTVSTAFVLGGIAGLLLGMALTQMEREPKHWYDRHR
jgi:uncharacterized small protein (DUF1192 family)